MKIIKLNNKYKVSDVNKKNIQMYSNSCRRKLNIFKIFNECAH